MFFKRILPLACRLLREIQHENNFSSVIEILSKANITLNDLMSFAEDEDHKDYSRYIIKNKDGNRNLQQMYMFKRKVVRKFTE